MSRPLRIQFPQFVLSGNEESLKAFYEAQRHSPILGGEEFMERVRQPGAIVGREHPRYERQAVQAEPKRVIRGRENEAAKSAVFIW